MNHTHIQALRELVQELLRDESTLKETDGVWSYEVAPIPGDRLSETEMDCVRSSDVPEEALLAVIGGKYFDVISASEQWLFFTCAERLQDLMPDAEQGEIMKALAGMVRVDPPVHYYMEQLG